MLIKTLPTLVIASLVLGSAPAMAVEVFPVIKNPSTDFDAADGDNSPALGRPFAFADPGTPFGLDTNGELNGNNVAVLTQLDGLVTTNGGVGFTLMAMSNGENGIDQTRNNGGDLEDDIPNTEPVSAVIEQVNGAGQKLQNGNVIRFSVWMRSDPSSPLTFAPQVEPMVKLEAWKEYGSLTQDTNPGLFAPQFGDKIFDQQQHGVVWSDFGYGVESGTQWVDLDGNGDIDQDPDADSEGRTTTLSTESWTLVESSYEIDDSFWLGIFNNNAGNPPDTSVVAALEEIRATVIFGDYTALTADPNTLEGGNLLVDNILVELFADWDEHNATPNPNPDPILDEGDDFLDSDFNKDGVVDVLDLDILGTNFNMAGDMSMGDANMDGVVDVLDLDILGSQFNMSSEDPPAAIAAPEPAAVGLALTFGAGALARVRRRR